ncbi:MAG TPA: trehalose-phosphatase [Gemmatimonadales bacterium]|nr:trehalose-phosphatase [Gemmatimonadales bacterium]
MPRSDTSSEVPRRRAAAVPAIGWEAAVFDLDGVLTFTAAIHAAAWTEMFDGYLRARSIRTGEPFRPFTESDYRDYVDGRPRYDGVRTFLASRGIRLPEGSPDDSPDLETVCGLGNRKNIRFHALVEQRGVPTDPAALELVLALRARGVRVGVASSSRNAAGIAARAGLDEHLDAMVDGVVAAQLGLAGKPAPDIFLECLHRLGSSEPGRAIVLEDADAGVEAGRHGGFGLVIGVDRGNRAISLREHGAAWVVPGLASITVEDLGRWYEGRHDARPNAIAQWAALAGQLAGRTPAIFLDYDGTLTPIASRPEQAVLAEDVRGALRAVARAWPTTIVSGRGREDVAALVGLEEITYAGSHGFDIAGPRASSLRFEVAPEIEPLVAEAAGELQRRAAGIEGAVVENKRFSIAVHYRLVAPERVSEVERVVEQALAGRPQLRKAHGKMVYELRPALDWDKGKAVLWLMEALGLGGSSIVPLYVGDDVTDEDAFRALTTRGIGMLVSEVPRPTAAHWSLQDVGEVRELLRRLASLPGAAG